MTMAASPVAQASQPNSPSAGTALGSATTTSGDFSPKSTTDNEAKDENNLLSTSYDEEDEEEEEAIKPWDEGGPSDCGYHETVHNTLMSVGKSVHVFMGEPGKSVSNMQRSIGNWFQELSYATRDILRGENTHDMKEDAAQAMKTLISGGEKSNEDTKTNDDDNNNISNFDEKKENVA